MWQGLIEEYYGAELVFETLWPQIRGQGVAQDDLIDALAMLWSAERLAAETSKSIPQQDERDRYGLRMEIVY